MSLYFSAKTNGFYNDCIHSEAQIPSDAVRITTDQHLAALNGQSTGKVITSDATGRPVLIDPPSPTTEQLAAAARTKRDGLITATDYMLMPDYPISPALLEQVKTYRQALRDIPLQTGFPSDIIWPVIPE